jgi:hypothetical protein
MIIPENTPPFIDDGRPFADRMADYIREHWGHELGPRASLLTDAAGLDRLADLTRIHCGPTPRTSRTVIEGAA